MCLYVYMYINKFVLKMWKYYGLEICKMEPNHIIYNKPFNAIITQITFPTRGIRMTYQLNQISNVLLSELFHL